MRWGDDFCSEFAEHSHSHSIRVIRLTHLQVLERARLSSTNALEVTFAGQTHDISVVYFRAGYSPNDYPSPREWQARTLLERSKAIKCPSVALQLAGAKKVQQVLSEEGVLESFGGRGRTLDSGALAAIRDSFTTLYPLDDSPLGREAYTLARQTPERFVLKPQREGGGNNVYRDDIPPFLDQLEEQDRQRPAGEPKAREGYILMDLIRPPSLENAMAPAGQGRIVRGSIISELGIYSTVLYRHRSGIEGAEVLSNKQVGHLLRTKASNVSEGGVATGYSVLDSPLLV